LRGNIWQEKQVSEVMAFGLEESFQPDLLQVFQVTMTGFILGIVIIAIHKIIKKYNLDSE
jgi:hypothetical protein